MDSNQKKVVVGSQVTSSTQVLSLASVTFKALAYPLNLFLTVS